MKTITLSLRKAITISMLLLLMVSGKSLMACNANFTHTNACTGDTIWFYAQDQFAVYTWDFGDSNSQININHDTSTFHVYTTAGTYYVTLFVNIGAEWEYQTQIITVGTDCFNANFSSICGGSNYLYFTDQSTGHIASYSWDFGDPSSGVDNTSNIASPNHLFSTTGNFLVRLIISDGIIADTIDQTVTVPVDCINANFFNNLGGTCLNDTTRFPVNYTGTITSYSWDFGDPSTGGDNTSSDPNPYHVYSALGMYDVTLIISDGVTTSTVHTIQTVIDCTVWPGDCNSDGEVNAEDILPLGIFYGTNGTTRSSASNSFTSQPSADWTGNIGDAMYLQNLLSTKHADCNGDGTISSLDIAAINANYGLRHNNHNNLSGMPEAASADPTMYIDFNANSGIAGTDVTATIYLGTPTQSFVSDLYGYSFTIDYDTSMIAANSATMDLSNNWLGNSSNELTISHDDYLHGKIDGAVVRKDQTQVSNNFGQIGAVTFHLKNTASGNLHLSISPTAKVIKANMFSSSASGNQEVFIPVNLGASDLPVNPMGIIESGTIESTINVFPNPAAGNVNIAFNGTEVSEINLTNALGEVVYSNTGSFNNKIQINTSQFALGVYSLTCKTNTGVMVKKISIIK